MAADNPFTPSFDRIVQAALDKWHVPGISFSVVHGDQTWCKGYGFAQTQPKIPVDSRTLFYAASTTKAQLCACWAVYIASKTNQHRPTSVRSQKKIDFATPLADIIRDDFVLDDPVRTGQVSLEDSVSHRTGMSRHESCYGKEGPSSTAEVTRTLRHLPLHNTLRTHFEYCNIMYMAATHALETVTGKPFSSIVREFLWQPLGMEHSYAGYGEAAAAVAAKGEVLARPHKWSKLPGDPAEHEGRLMEMEYMDFPEVSGAGYAISCAEDYAKWMRCLLDASGPLSKEMIHELWKPRSIVPPEDEVRGGDCTPFDGRMLMYALGWFVGSYRGHKVIWHPGGLVGAGSLVMLVPSLKWGMTMFANGQDVSLTLKGLAFVLLDDLLGVPQSERWEQECIEREAIETYQVSMKKFDTARERLFPDAPPIATVPLTLPIEEYAGIYRNLGYGTFTFTVDGESKSRLRSTLQRCWPCILRLDHVNAESWLVTRSASLDDPLPSVTRAETRIGADGKVRELGIVLEQRMPDVLVWFGKVE